MHFTGKQRDTETNLDDFGARYFTSTMGRWVTPDWSARPNAEQYADLNNPQSLNLYAYVSNNPTTHVDADGHAVEAANNFAQGMEMQGDGPSDAFPDTSAQSGDEPGDPEIDAQLMGQEQQALEAQQQAAEAQPQLAVTPDASQPRVVAGGYQEVVDYKQGTIAKGHFALLSDKDASGHKVELKEKLVSGSNVKTCTGQCVTHGTLTDIMQVGGGRSHSVIKRFTIDDKPVKIYDPGTKKVYDFLRVNASSKNPQTPFVFIYKNDPH